MLLFEHASLQHETFSKLYIIVVALVIQELLEATTGCRDI
jgi:hypothetical protein